MRDLTQEISVADGGGHDALSTGSVAFAWDSDFNGFVLTITIEAGKNYVGDVITIAKANLQDRTENVKASEITITLQ